MTVPPEFDTVRRIVDQLLALKGAGALDAVATSPGSSVWRWRFRAGGWPIDVVIDQSVLEVRVYHGRDEVAMGRIPEHVANALIAASGPGTPDHAAADAAIARLREVVAEWKSMNARIYIQPPVKVGHPDNWNDA